MNKKAIAMIALLLGIALLLCACGSAEKLTEYEMGVDKVQSINTVIGETRKVTGVSTGTNNGVQYKEYDYETKSMVDDLAAYFAYLQENGWLATKDYDLTTGKGEAQFAIESADSGKILVMSFAFDANKYTIRVNKLEGTLESN